MTRSGSGIDEGLGAPAIDGIQAAGEWLYHNPFGRPRLSDEETAVADAVWKCTSMYAAARAFIPWRRAAGSVSGLHDKKRCQVRGKYQDSEPQLDRIKGAAAMEKKEQQHKRRVRYKGTHPRNYQEKYKELQPENTQTPSGRSLKRAVRLQECISPLW